MRDKGYLGEVGLILLMFVLLIICIPLMIGMLIGYLLGLTGLDYYGAVSIVACVIWVLMFLYYFVL